jgi:hypothetical protein
MAIGLVIAIVVVIVTGIVGYILIKKYKQRQDAKGGKTIVVSGIDGNNVSSIRAAVPNAQDETYEPQYHPKVEIGNIFGNAKMNHADDVRMDLGHNDTDHMDEDNRDSVMGNTFQTQIIANGKI